MPTTITIACNTMVYSPNDSSSVPTVYFNSSRGPYMVAFDQIDAPKGRENTRPLYSLTEQRYRLRETTEINHVALTLHWPHPPQ